MAVYYNKNGMDVAALWEYRQRNGSIHGFPGQNRRIRPSCW